MAAAWVPGESVLLATLVEGTTSYGRLRVPTILSTADFGDAADLIPSLPADDLANASWPCAMIAAAIYNDCRGDFFDEIDDVDPDFQAVFRSVCVYVKTNYEPCINAPIVCAPRWY